MTEGEKARIVNVQSFVPLLCSGAISWRFPQARISGGPAKTSTPLTPTLSHSGEREKQRHGIDKPVLRFPAKICHYSARFILPHV